MHCTIDRAIDRSINWIESIRLNRTMDEEFLQLNILCRISLFCFFQVTFKLANKIIIRLLTYSPYVFSNILDIVNILLLVRFMRNKITITIIFPFYVNIIATTTFIIYYVSLYVYLLYFLLLSVFLIDVWEQRL